MRHVIHQENIKRTYKVVILIKEQHLNKQYLEEFYVHPLNKLGISSENIVSISLDYNAQDKAPVKHQRESLKNVLKAVKKVQATHVLCCDSNYFKTLTKQRTSEPHHGYIMECAIKDYSNLKIVLGTNYNALFHNPNLQSKIDMSLTTISDHIQGTFKELGANIIHSYKFPSSTKAIDVALKKLHKYPAITCDIETYGLHLRQSGVATIAFAWDKHNGIAFNVSHTNNGFTGHIIKNKLKNFFLKYKGKIIYHGSNFDIKHIIYNIFMDNSLHQTGLLKGLQTMFNNMEDTKIITYLATNSTAGNNLKLKDNAFEYTGNYAQDDIDDLHKIPETELLKYNLTDALATWYVYEKNRPIMVRDKQEKIYNEIMLPSLKVIAQMELTGMPVNADTIDSINIELNNILNNHLTVLDKFPEIIDFTKELQMIALLKKNAELKTKVKVITDFADIKFNPASNKQTAKLLHEWFHLDVIDTTNTGAPSVGKDTLKKHLAIITNPTQQAILTILIGIADVSIILKTFIKSLKTNVIHKADGHTYLHGNFNLGGTKSGRLSSNGPNLQNIPATGTDYATEIKKCFNAPQGWLMIGADFTSLEDKISALTTKDPNKLKVYTDGYDGHCLRAHSYFGHLMPKITTSQSSINSIKKLFPDLRQKSKGPTFCLTYMGTSYALVNQCGIPLKEAKIIESKYHELYKVSDKWVADKVKEGSKIGHVVGAFGLWLRTPIIQQTLLQKKSTPYESSAESRTAGNMLGQSYGLLNNRASIEFQQRILDSKYSHYIKPIAHIHDSMYFIVKNHIGAVKWFNDNLIECMQWQDLPELQHPLVKLGGECEIFYPDWSNPIKLPNGASKAEIYFICKNAKLK